MPSKANLGIVHCCPLSMSSILSDADAVQEVMAWSACTISAENIFLFPSLIGLFCLPPVCKNINFASNFPLCGIWHGTLLLLCPSFDVQRRDLLAGVLVVLQPFAEINGLPNDAIVQILLYGDKKLSTEFNKSVLELTLVFFHNTGRFH